MKPLPNNVLKCIDPSERKRMGKGARTWDEVETDNAVKDERTLQKQIAMFLIQRDIWHNRSRMDKRTTNRRGTPDFLFVWNGRPYAFECKIRKEEPTDDQIECHSHMRRNGWLVFVVRSLQQAVEFLDGRPQEL